MLSNACKSSTPAYSNHILDWAPAATGHMCREARLTWKIAEFSISCFKTGKVSHNLFLPREAMLCLHFLTCTSLKGACLLCCIIVFPCNIWVTYETTADYDTWSTEYTQYYPPLHPSTNNACRNARTDHPFHYTAMMCTNFWSHMRSNWGSCPGKKRELIQKEGAQLWYAGCITPPEY